MGGGGDFWRSFGGFGRPPGRGDGFEKLPEEERQRVRHALEQAWNRPDVIQKRDAASRANDEFRAGLQQALKEIDPGVAAILDKIRPPQFDPSKLPPLPPPDAPEFPRAVSDRLGEELVGFSRPEHKEQAREWHQKIMQRPAVVEAFNQLRDAQPSERMAKVQALREAYRAAVSDNFRRMREQNGGGEKGRGPSGGPGPRYKGNEEGPDKEKAKGAPAPPA